MKNILSAVTAYFKKLDKLLLLAVCLCTVLGIILLFSLYKNNTIDASYYKTQLISMGIGLCACLVIAGLDYQKLAKLWFLYATVALGLVGLTFTSLGIGVEGADDVAWLRFGPISFQPAEVLKIAFLLSFSFHLYKVKDDMNSLLNILLICLHGAVPIALVMKQGDHGTALVFIVMFIVMVYAAGISIGYILLAIVAIPPAAIVAWKFLLGSVQKERIMILFNPGSDPEGLEWQQDIGLSSLASGKVFGHGLMPTTKSNVPEIHNDFIFAYVGQTLGYVGCLALIAVMLYICIKIIANSRNTREELGKNICMGAFAMLFTHYTMNIGMVLKVMPVIGIPLPFVSAGGTALVSMYIIIGLVLSTREHNEKIYRMFA